MFSDPWSFFPQSTRSWDTGPQTPLDGDFAFMEATFKPRGSTATLTTAGTQLGTATYTNMIVEHKLCMLCPFFEFSINVHREQTTTLHKKIE